MRVTTASDFSSSSREEPSSPIALESSVPRRINAQAPATSRLVGVKAVMPTPMGELPTTSVIEKWITIGPRKVPSRTVIKMMGMEQVMQIDKVVTDSFDPDVFDLPPAIKALADAKKAAKKASDGDASSSGSKDSSSSSGGGR